MQGTLFYHLGKLIYRFRWLVIGMWALMILACVPFLPNIITPFKTTGFVDSTAESTKTQDYLDQKLGYDSYNKIIIIYKSNSLKTTDPAYHNKIKKSLSGLKNFSIKSEIIYPEDNSKQISKDKHTAYAVIILKDKEKISDKLLDEFKSKIKKPSNMSMWLGGEPIFVEKVSQQTQEDLYKSDLVTIPLSLIVLIIIFGSLVAAGIPIILGGVCAILMLTSLYFLGHAFSLSVFTLNIALLLGLCLCLDYSLFIINRFRDELKTKELSEAIACTQASAAHAILFSGLAVFASLSALLLFPINILFSMGIGGLVAVFFAVSIAIILLPAVLSILGDKVNSLSLHFGRKNKKFNFWHELAEKITKRPIFYFISILIVLLMLGYPFLSAKFGVSDYRLFPVHSQPRHFFDIYAEKFNENELNPILMVVKSKKAPILSRNNIEKLYDLAHKLKENPLIKQVNSIVTLTGKLTKSQYADLYQRNKDSLDPNIKQLLSTTTRQYFTIINLVGKYPLNTPQTKKLISNLREVSPPHNMEIKLAGTPVSNDELLHTISRTIPYAILWIMVFTYLILLCLLRSVFLPFKAILMNILSLCASYGALVLVFQDGHLHQFLNFEPQGMLDISLLVIIFCALFGFSMDYEVFLLSRIKESYEELGDNRKSIVYGLEKSSKIITSAALIVICICFSFLVADILLVKAFGLGIAVAIFVDAFLVRTLLVPSTMTLVKKINWYIPRWLDRILPRL